MTLQEFKNKYNGKQVEYHSYSSNSKYQCVDLVNQYLVEVLGLDPIIGTDAKNFKDNYNKEQLEWIPNTPLAIIEEGSIPVWNGRVGGGAGHVAVALAGADVNRFTSLDQNWSKKQEVTIEAHNYNNVSGWLRPKGGDMSDEYGDMVHKSGQYDLVTKSIWPDRDPRQVSAEEIISHIGGLKSRITTLSNQIGEYQAEAKTATEKANRLEALLLKADEKNNALSIDLKEALEEMNIIAEEKGVLTVQIEQLKQQLETCKLGAGEGHYTITIRELITLILNQSITIKRS